MEQIKAALLPQPKHTEFSFSLKQMLQSALYLFLILHIFPRFPTTATAAATLPAAYTATDLILLNCGTSSNSNFFDTSSRSWETDHPSRYTPANTLNISSAIGAIDVDPASLQVPYETARIFHEPLTYIFSVRTTGPKFLRLYFNPTMYSDYNTSRSFFSVTANGFTLLSNFSAFLNSPSTTNSSFMKEFVIHVDEKQRLDLTFYPNTNSFAFVNGIEIVSIPDTLYYTGKPLNFRQLYNDQLYYLKNDTALENLYRLNIGGIAIVEIQDDSGPTRGMFRAWSLDDDYIVGADFGYTPYAPELQINYTTQTPFYIAPPTVYTTSRTMSYTSTSMEWAFPVDSGFNYLLRFHFCEFQIEVTKLNQRVFTISIDNKIMDTEVDVIYFAGGAEIPIFKDYVTMVDDDGRRGQKNLRLSLFPNTDSMPKYSNALLNGLEIFKLSDSKQSLAAANPYPIKDSSPPTMVLKQPGDKKNNGSLVIYVVIGSVIGIFAVIAAMVSFLILRRRRRLTNSFTTTANMSCDLVSTTRTSGSQTPMSFDLCRHFSLKEIKTATGNFDHNFIIGKGGFGNVYRGFIDDGATAVAIKRLNPSSNQGQHEFLTEIKMLSKLRHIHLVSLIGYCDENREMILVYDYMAHGTLDDHLYNSENTPLTWKQRLQICMGAAKGLQHLHAGTENVVIHRDVKSTNILLDEKWVAKISDFGLSKMGAVNESFTHITTNIKGTYGYLDPEYFLSHKLTRKSDVYAFGVVLFEVLSGRPAVDMRLEEEQHSLAGWARYCIREGKVNQLISHNLIGQISPACLKVFAEIAGRCVLIRPQGRPTMADVVMGLEFALLQQGEDPTEGEENAAQIYSNQRDGDISMDDPQKGESDRIANEHNPTQV